MRVIGVDGAFVYLVILEGEVKALAEAMAVYKAGKDGGRRWLCQQLEQIASQVAERSAPVPS